MDVGLQDNLPCPENCVECDSSSKCNVCQQTFYKTTDNKCVSCPYNDNLMSYCLECLETKDWYFNLKIYIYFF